jgi:orotate phosphoribosyltransferase
MISEIHQDMPAIANAKARLLALLRRKSVFHGEFVLSSGAKSSYYIDCRLTTLDPEGAWLVGRVMLSLIQSEAASKGITIRAAGGLTMGADPIALAVGMCSFLEKDTPALQTFIVRKTPKAHGQAKRIEGNFKSGDLVVVLDDVVTRGDSTLSAINAVEKEGGKVAFVAVLVDRQEGGRERIEQLGYRVVAAFQRNELIENCAEPPKPATCVPAGVS